MRTVRPLAGALALALLAACGGGAKAREDAGLTPTFAPETTTAEHASTSAPASTTTTSPGAAPTTAATTGAPVGETGTPPVEVAITDPAGDATPSPVDRPPAWADIIGARLLRTGDTFELRIRLAGGDAPETTDDQHTMNLASFYDVDGDGGVDYEVWANLADGGWGAAYYDNGPDQGGAGEGSGVDVTTDGDEVVLRFPTAHLGGAERFRWSTASEWGRYEALSTPAMARDDAPDDDRAVAFPAS